MRRSSVLLLLILAVACCGGGGGGGGGVPAVPPSPPPAEAEPNDQPAQALDLGAVSSAIATGRISETASAAGLPTGDLDLFRVTPTASGSLEATLTSPTGSDFDLGLLDAAGKRIATARTTRPIEVLRVRVVKDQPILIQASGYSGEPGDYELRIALTPAADASTRPAPSPMSEARCFHGLAAFVDGGAIVGGGTKTPWSPEQAFLGGVASTEIFNPNTGKFTLGPDLGVGRFGVTATTLPDGRVLFAGGDLAGTALLFDPDTAEMDGESIPMARGMRALHTATLLPCGRVLIVGGARIALTLPPSAEKLNTAEIFDPKTGSFTALPDLTAVRFSHATCLLADGRVLITGGEKLATTEIVDPGNLDAGCTSGPAMTAARDDHTATLLMDGRVLLAGGQVWGGGTQDNAEILDDVTATPTSAFRPVEATMSTIRSDHVSLLLPDGTVLILGGEYDPHNLPDVILKAVDLFDPATETFKALPDLESGRDDHRAAMIGDGRVLVTGGENVEQKSIPDVEAYRPAE